MNGLAPRPAWASRARSQRLGPLRCTVIAALTICAAMLGTSKPSQAWDPSTTHQGLLDHALRTSQWHRRWMDQTGLQRGLFTSVRLDPARLRTAEDPAVSRVLRVAHEDIGALPLGGPWSCPKPPAPEETSRYCVEGSIWSQTALGWIRLGMIAESTPAERQIHHFYALTPTGAEAQWSDAEAAGGRLRQRSVKSNGLSRVALLTRSRGVDRAMSAIGWLHATNDALAPAQMARNLELASTSADRAARDHHLALALMQLGALLHVVQDAAVPAHARGDLRAFTGHLSPRPRDRGLALQEVARSLYGRADLPLDKPVPVAVDAAPLATTIEAHLVSPNEDIGLARFAAAHFISEGDLPAARAVPRDLSPEQAAALLLGGVSLSAAELEGAALRGWPTDRGYLVTSEGRALAGYVVDESDRVRLFIDRLILREQAAILLPKAAAVTRSILDLVFPRFPAASWSAGGDTLSIDIPAHYAKGRLVLLREDSDGRRSSIKELALRPGQFQSLSGLQAAWTGGQAIVVLVLGFQDGLATVQEQRGISLPGAPGQPTEPVAPVDVAPTTGETLVVPADGSGQDVLKADPGALTSAGTPQETGTSTASPATGGGAVSASTGADSATRDPASVPPASAPKKLPPSRTDPASPSATRSEPTKAPSPK